MKIALVGVNGFGLQHLWTLQSFIQEGRCNLVAVADPESPAGPAGAPKMSRATCWSTSPRS